MSVSESLGERRTVEVPAGTIEYRERGAGPALLFVHGVGVNGDLWRKVVPLLAGGFRCIAPDWPFGSHTRPLRDGTEMALPGLARIVGDFIDATGLDEPCVVANDTGGAVAQWLVGHHPHQAGRLVLTSCDAWDRFPPLPQRYLKPAARLGLLGLVARAVQYQPVQRTPTAYGWATREPVDPAIMRSYTRPIATIPGVRRDLQRLLLAVSTRYTHRAADALPRFDKPALVAWAADDKLFPLAHGRRLAELLPQGRFTTVANSRTFIPEDQPERLAALISGRS
jgi:pimeloyl-ACP methyl ester carboxylesterase